MKSTRLVAVLGALLLFGGLLALSRSREGGAGHRPATESPDRAASVRSGRSITDHAIEWPSREQLHRVLTLADYNTRVVFAGVSALGAVGGLVGTFLLLRKRSLLSDTLSHCTLPGIALAFLVAEALGQSGRSLPWLLAGATVTGTLGMMAVAAIRSRTRVKDDAALAIVLSVFFGLGIALLVVIQQLPSGNAAGLSHYIYGKAAAMTAGDAQLILGASLAVTLVCALLFKEFKLLCFDVSFAQAQGWPVVVLDLTLMSLVVGVTVIGLQAVGLLLVVALLIIPAAAARFWSDRLGTTVWVASALGAASGLAGVAGSALFPKLPAGAVIVLAALLCFSVSFAFGARRGLFMRWFRQRRVELRVARQHLLRALYEWCESAAAASEHDSPVLLERDVPLAGLRRANHWDVRRLTRLLRRGMADGLVVWTPGAATCRLSSPGRLEARRVTRNHRLWEAYLLNYADVAPQHIHHNADQIEHVIEPDVVNELEELMAGRAAGALVPADPGLPSARGKGAVA